MPLSQWCAVALAALLPALAACGAGFTRPAGADVDGRMVVDGAGSAD